MATTLTLETAGTSSPRGYGPPSSARRARWDSCSSPVIRLGVPTSLHKITPAEAGLALGWSVINIDRYGPRVLPLLSDMAREASCYSIESGDLREAVSAIAKVTGVS